MSRERAWSKFWWEDWESDQALVNCSYAAQGLWMRILCIMNRSERRGYLSVNGKPMPISQLRHITNPKSGERWTLLLHELRENGVFSVDKQGFMYSRRMVRDEQMYKQKQAAGQKGGNPALRKCLSTGLTGSLNLEAEAEAEAGRSTSSSSSMRANGQHDGPHDGKLGWMRKYLQPIEDQ